MPYVDGNKYPKRDSINLYIRVREGQKYFEVDLSKRLISMTYTDAEKKSDEIVLKVDNFDLYFFDNPVFRPGNIIEATWGYPGNMAPTRRLCIHTIKGNTVVNVEAKGGATLMAEQARKAVYEDTTPDEVARIIAARNGYGEEIRYIEPSFIEPRTYVQSSQTDAQMMRKLANRIGYEFYIDYDGFHFHKRKMGQAPTRELTYYTDRRGHIISFNVTENIFQKKDAVKIKGKDPITKKSFKVIATTSTSDMFYTDGYSSISETALFPERSLLMEEESIAYEAGAVSRPEELPLGIARIDADFIESAKETLGADIGEYRAFPVTRADGLVDLYGIDGSLPPEDIQRIVGELKTLDNGYLRQDMPVEESNVDISQKEAKSLANAKLRKSKQKSITIDMTVVGDPNYVAKTTILVSNLGKRLSGKYYVKEVVHNMSTSSGYTCNLSLVADGHSGWNTEGFVGLITSKAQRRAAVNNKISTRKPKIKDEFQKELNLSDADITASNAISIRNEIEALKVKQAALTSEANAFLSGQTEVDVQQGVNLQQEAAFLQTEIETKQLQYGQVRDAVLANTSEDKLQNSTTSAETNKVEE